MVETGEIKGEKYFIKELREEVEENRKILEEL
jgi:hypothetical protein